MTSSVRAVQRTTDDLETAKDTLEAGFGAWDLTGKLFYTGHACWLLKEFFWVMLLSPIAFIFGGIAFICVAFAVFRRLDGGTSGKMYGEVPAEICVGFIHLTWLIANIVDMITTFNFGEEPDEVPKYAEDFVAMCGDPTVDDSCRKAFDTWMTLTKVLYCVPITLWVVSCTYLFYKWMSPPRFVAQGYAFQTCLLDGGWLTFWVVKDLAWSFDAKAATVVAIIAWVIHFFLLQAAFVSASAQVYLWNGLTADERERIGTLKCDLPMISYTIWSIGALLWLLMEEEFDEDLTVRYIAACVMMTAFICFLAGYKQSMAKGNTLLMLAHKGVPGGAATGVAPPESQMIGAGERSNPSQRSQH